MSRRILRLDEGRLTVATESRFALEADLHSAVAAHPHVLPSEDLGLGPLVTLCQELDLGHGPLDLLAVDPAGRVAIVEFKRGTENPDVRKVIAQLLDYGSALWRQTVDSLTQRINETISPLEGGLTDHVGVRLEALGIEFEPEAFLTGLAASLERGDFVFLYVARDLDERTKRVMTYLAEGPRLTFFGVEVDYFLGEDAHNAVMVPRTAFVPSWVLSGEKPTASAPPVSEAIESTGGAVAELVTLLEGTAEPLGLKVDNSKAARHYRPGPGVSGISVYPSDGRVYWDLSAFRQAGRDDLAE